MIRLVGIAIVAAVTGGAAHASVITFSGAAAQEGDVALSFSGRVNDSADTGTVAVDYFVDNTTAPAPIFGSETITGPASFVQASGAFPPGSLELDLKITNGSTFELKETTFSGLIVDFSDPSKGVGLEDRAVLTNFAISNVPLPASAPLFGAALLALGAATYGAKRRSPRAAL